MSAEEVRRSRAALAEGDPEATTAHEIGELRSHLRHLARWYRLMDGVWGISSRAIVGVAAAFAVLLVARLTPIERDWEAALGLLGAWLAALTAWYALRRTTELDTARRTDHDLGLKDRLATAVVFRRIEDPEAALVHRQRADALNAARSIEPRSALPLALDRRPLTIAGVLSLAIVVLLVVPNPQHEVLAQREAVKLAAQEEAENIREVRTPLQDDEALSEEDRSKLVSELKALEERLRHNEGRTDEALADIAEAEGQLRELRDRGAVRRGEAAQDLAERMDRLGRATSARSSGSEEPESSASASSLPEALEGLESLSADEREALAEELAEMSLTASADLPAAADALAEASDAVLAGDQVAASEAAQGAERALGNAAAAAEGARTVEGALAQLQGSREAISAASAGEQAASVAQLAPWQSSSGQSGSQAGSQGGSQGSGQVEGPSPGEGQGAGQAQGQGQGQQGGQGQGQGQSGSQGQGQSGGQGQGQSAGQGAESGAGQSSGQGSSSTAGGGAGGGFGRSGEGSSQVSGAVQGSSSGHEYEPVGPAQGYVEGRANLIYSPDRRGAPGESVFVPGRVSDASGRLLPWERTTRSEGASSPALVPYQQVYGRYGRAAGEALQRETIPLRLRDYVKQYFAQLEPQ